MFKNLKTKTYNLLRKSEKYTKTDMVYLAKGGFWLTLGQVVSSVAAFLLAVAFANLLPKETYGTYKYVLSIMGILAIPTLSGMGTAITQAVARGYEGSLIPALKTKIHWGLLGGLAGLGLAGYYYFNGNMTLTISFLIIAVFVPFMDSFGIYGALLNGKKLFKISTKYGIISQIIAIGSLITALFFTKNIFLILFVYFTSWTLLRLIFLKISLKKFPPNKKQDPKTISYGKHLSAIAIISTIAGQLDKILVFHYLGTAELAIYFFAISPLNQLKGIYKNIAMLAIPKLSNRSIEEINSLFFKRIFQLVLIGIIIAGGYVLAAPYFFKIFFPQYRESVFFSQLFSASIAFALPQTISGTARISKLTITPKNLLYLSNVSNFILIFSLFLLTPKIGIAGAIFSKIIFLFSGLIIDIIIWKKIEKNAKNKNGA